MNTKTRSKKHSPLTIITTHFNPDYDAVGSMVAARKLYPEALLVFPGGSEKNLRHFFIQSLIHLIEPARVNDVDLSQVGRLVVVDTRQPSRLGEVAEVLQNPELDIHLYDHHPDAPGDLEGQIEVVKMVGATVTILMAEIDRCGVEILPEEATMMAVGLYEDTGSFTFSSTTTQDYWAGAELLKRGADLAVISQLTVRELTPEQLALLNELINSAETHQVRGLSMVIAATQIENYIDDIAVLAHKMMEIMGLSTLFLLVAMDNKVQLIIRSRLGEINAAEIARNFGGGGHPSAAAASIKDMSLTQAKQELEAILLKTLGAFYQADNLMVSPPITIGTWQTLEEARDILIKFSINVLLAVDHDGKVMGFISEHNISKALYHGLLNYQVSNFMNTEFISVPPEADFNKIKEIIVDRKQRILPVVKGERPVGVITRTDLLQVLAASHDESERPGKKQNEPSRRNVAPLMRECMPLGLVNLLQQMGSIADQAGVKLYAVGGCVRDLIMRQCCQDIDLTMDGDIDDFIARVQQTLKVTKIIAHPRFKTATLETAEGYVLDISTTRQEYYESPGALPVVQMGSLRMDLYRRDFTINSLAVALNSTHFGELIDFYRGYQDIKDGYIRVLHNLSFVEDPTRAFRAVRFESRLKFKISKMTASLLEGAVRNNFLTKLDRRRLLNEMKIILSEEDPGPALKQLHEFKLLPFIHPKIELKPTSFNEFTKVRQVRDWLSLTSPEHLEQIWLVYLLVLTEQLKVPELAELANSLTLKKKDALILTHEKTRASEILKHFRKAQSNLTPSLIYQIFSGLSWPSVLFIMAKTKNKDLSQAGVSYLTTYRLVEPFSNGDDLMALGIPRGPMVRQAHEALRLAHLEGLITTFQDEVAYIKEKQASGEEFFPTLPPHLKRLSLSPEEARLFDVKQKEMAGKIKEADEVLKRR